MCKDRSYVPLSSQVDAGPTEANFDWKDGHTSARQQKKTILNTTIKYVLPRLPTEVTLSLPAKSLEPGDSKVPALLVAFQI